MTEELVAADPDVLQAADEGRHVLQGGEVVVAQVETPEAVEVSQGCWAEVCEAGVVRERQSLGEGQVGQAARRHLPQKGTVTHLNTDRSVYIRQDSTGSSPKLESCLK